MLNDLTVILLHLTASRSAVLSEYLGFKKKVQGFKFSGTVPDLQHVLFGCGVKKMIYRD